MNEHPNTHPLPLFLPGVAGSPRQLDFHEGRGFPYFLLVLKGSGLFRVQDVMH